MVGNRAKAAQTVEAGRLEGTENGEARWQRGLRSTKTELRALRPLRALGDSTALRRRGRALRGGDEAPRVGRQNETSPPKHPAPPMRRDVSRPTATPTIPPRKPRRPGSPATHPAPPSKARRRPAPRTAAAIPLRPTRRPRRRRYKTGRVRRNDAARAPPERKNPGARGGRGFAGRLSGGRIALKRYAFAVEPCSGSASIKK